MFDRILTVNYNNSKDSFLHLFSKQIKTGSCVQLTYGDNRIAYFSVSVSTVKLSDDCVSLSSLYARSLGIAENELVRITEISNLPTVTRISIAPVNTNEYEILELLAENVQSTLLDQIRVINAGQKFVVWLASNINVAVYVEDVIPTTPGMIDFLTEVVVKPKSDITVAVNDNSAVFNINKLKSLTSNLHEHKTNKNLQKFAKFKPNLICRIIPARKLPFVDEIEGHCKDFNAFISKETIPKSWFCNNSIIICRVKLLTVDLLSEKEVFVRLCILDDLLGESCANLRDNLFVSSTIFQHFNSPFGHRAILTFVDENPVVHEIIINTKKNYLVNVEETFKLYLTKNCHDVTVLSQDVALDMDHYVKCSLKFMPDEAKFCVVDSDLLRNYKFQINEGAMVQSDDKTCVTSKSVFLEEISNFQDITRQILNVFSRKGSRWENVLIIGRPGTGKSSLLKILADKLNLYPNFIFTRTIQCKAIKGKTLDSLYKLLSSALSELVLCQPSVLFFDDFHLLCECVNGDEAAPNAVHFNRISEMMHTYLQMCPQYNRIGICATTESTSKLNKNVYSSRGTHLFKNLFSIDDLSKEDRLNFFKYFFQKFNITDIDFDYFSIKSEGFVVQDLTDFCNKSVFEACKDACDVENVTINEDHCERALTKTCLLSLQNVKLHSPGSKTFSEIGGLHDVKKVLIESLMWPAQGLSEQDDEVNLNFGVIPETIPVSTKPIDGNVLKYVADYVYPDIFAKAPLPLQSGLLLYGPPGTGKTLLAGAAAHCGLRLISIKGPELLSKYIGASEQAVRDVFQKAQSARPCILFFDEFDSLAPRRGHDNTGVTDRVVNQLLTQLDGVESLSGVCVLAATSRPDLLDPALLRPGRLDRQVLCPLPSKDDRLEIVSLLSKNLDLADDVDLKSIASATEGYSGADLQSILYTAQLSTIDDLLLDDSKEPLIKSQITQSHLLEALNKTRPSLSEQERLRYEKIYSKFQGGGPVEDFRAGSKATLA